MEQQYNDGPADVLAREETERDYQSRIARRNEGALEDIAAILRRPEWPGSEALEWISEILTNAGYDLRNGETDEGEKVRDGKIVSAYWVTLSTMVKVEADEDVAGDLALESLQRSHPSAFEWNVEDVQLTDE